VERKGDKDGEAEKARNGSWDVGMMDVFYFRIAAHSSQFPTLSTLISPFALSWSYAISSTTIINRSDKTNHSNEIRHVFDKHTSR
jgi:hypothetical protein